MRFKENLRSIRKRNRISQEELAAYLGVSQRTACYFNITLDELIGYNKEDWM